MPSNLSNRTLTWILTLLSILLALFLSSLNLGLSSSNNGTQWSQALPNWTLLWTILYTQCLGVRGHFTPCFILGLLYDALLNYPLGTHSLLFVLVRYCLIRFSTQINLYPVKEQQIMMLVLISIFYLFQLGLQRLINAPLPAYTYWLQLLTTSTTWLLLYHWRYHSDQTKSPRKPLSNKMINS